MNKTYQKPVIELSPEAAEGVYLASGCYSTTYEIHQTQQDGRVDYRIQVNGKHETNHTRETQWMTIVFSIPVTYVSSNGTLLSGNGTNTLKIEYHYHQNGTDNIGLGDLVVSADAGLSVSSITITD